MIRNHSIFYLFIVALLALPAWGQGTVSAPVFTPPSGTQFANGQIITVTSATSGATLCYTLDGSTPAATTPGTCSHGTTLTNGGTINISATETVNVLGTLSSDTNSSMVSASYTVGGGVTSNIDDIPPVSNSSPTIGWATPPYIDSGCGDPTGPTSYPHTIGNTSPSVDGFSSLFTIVSAPEGCVGWDYKGGAQDTKNTTVTHDFEYESGSTNSTGNANEFDIFLYEFAANSASCLPHDTEFYWGTQCVTSTGNLQIWDEAVGGTWHYTSPTISCASAFASGTGFHHITVNDYWTCGDTSGTSGYPKQCYNSIVLDGVTHQINTCYSARALPNGYSENTGVNYELDVGSAGTTLSANVDEASFTFAPSTYYIAANGSDSNDGRTKLTPWLHAPGMPNCSSVCANYGGTIPSEPGDSFIFRGGDTWHFGNSSASPFVGGSCVGNTGTGGYVCWTWQWSGSSGSPIYIGVDQTWYSGSSWTRPILSGDNPLWTGSGYPATCTYNFAADNTGSASSIFLLNEQSYTIFDNFEFTGLCYSGNPNSVAYIAQEGGVSLNDTISNVYFHGWTRTPSWNGTVNTSGTSVTWVSGQHFNQYSGIPSGSRININGTNYTTSGTPTSTSLTLTSSAGTQSGVGYAAGSGEQNYAISSEGGGGSAIDNDIYTGLVIDGSDSPHFAPGDSADCPSTEGVNGCATGGGIYGRASYVTKSILRYLSNAVVSTQTCAWHDNLVEYIYNSPVVGAQHSNFLNNDNTNGCTTTSIYNNVFRHGFANEAFYLNNINLYFFNNTIYDMMNGSDGSSTFLNPAGCIYLNGPNPANTTSNIYVYNNTFGDASCQFSPALADGGGNSYFYGNFFWQNNHFIGYTTSSLNSTTCAAGGASCPLNLADCTGSCSVLASTDHGNELFQSSSTASSQGYAASSNYQPTTSGSSVGNGANLTSSCSTFSFDSALCSGTSLGVSEQFGNGGLIASYPALPVTSRPTGSAAWYSDSFASNFTLGIPGLVPSTCSIGTNTYYISQSGSDSHTQTQAKSKTTPWQHAPYMASFTGTFSHDSGNDCFIFRGGDTWVSTDYSVITAGGTSSAQDFYGADSTWYTGSSWTRPLLSIAGNLPNQLSVGNNGYTGNVTVSGTSVTLTSGSNFSTVWPSGTSIILNSTTCTISSVNSTSSITLTSACGSSGTYNIPTYESSIFRFEAPWITVDSFEVTGLTCRPTVGGVLFYPTNAIQDGLIFTNNYIHYFESPTYSCTGTTAADKLNDGNNAAIWLLTQLSVNTSLCHGAAEYNVVDGTDGTGNKGYQVTAFDGPAFCFNQFAYNVIHDVCSGTSGYYQNVHDNAIYNFGGQIGQYECASVLGLHNHALRSNGDLPGMAVYNNRLSATEGETISINPITGTTYVYNNVGWDNGPDFVQVGDNGSGCCSSGSVLFANNTAEVVSGGGSPMLQVRQAITALTIASNFGICPSATFASCYSGTSDATTFTNSGGETYLTASQAATDGYTSSQTYPYFPTASSSPTVGAGKTGIFSGETLATTRGCYQGTVNGVVQSVCPTITAATRASSGTCTPGTAGCADSGSDMFTPSTASFTCTPSTIPANHSGHISLSCTGSGTSWTGSTAFTVSSPGTLVSYSNTSATQETVILTTSSSTGSVTITDTTDSINTTVTASTASLSVTPASGVLNTTPSITLTGSSQVWSQETASTLFSVSGSGCSGESIGSISVSTNTTATATLTIGTTACTITITDNSTGATATFTAAPMAYNVGGNAGNNGTSSSSTFTFTYTPQATNDAVLFALYCHGSTIPSSATLSASGWTLNELITPVSNGTGAGVLFGGIAPNTSTTTFTAGFGGVNCSSFWGEIPAEFSGNSTSSTFVVKGSSGGASGGCNQSAAAITPSSNNNAVWYACFDAPTGATSPWVAGLADGGGGDLSEYKLLSGGSGSAQTPAYTGTTGAYVVLGTSVVPAGTLSPASTPTFSPVAGTYTGTQSVTISSTSSGVIICYNTTGSPATNGTTGCTTGTLYTGAVSVGSSETLYAVAGGTGYTNSSVGSAAYTINSPSAPTTSVSGTSGSITTTSAVITGSSWTCTGLCINNPTSEGVCYATTANPTTPCTSDSSNPYNSTLSGLSASTTYHYRSYATNIVGTTYGSDTTFTTNSILTLSLLGSGTVTATATGYSPLVCITTGTFQNCSQSYSSGTSITLTESSPGTYFTFSGFTDLASDACGAPGVPASSPCTITLNASETVYGGFMHTYANFTRLVQQIATGCTMASTSSGVLTCSSNPFLSTMVNSGITVSGAGYSGGLLSTTVLSYTNSGSVTLAQNAKTVVTGAATVTLNHPLDIVQLNLGLNQTPSTVCPVFTQANSYGCLPQLGNIIGASGTCFTQPSFGGALCRMTNGNSMPNKTTYSQRWENILGNSEQNNTFSIGDDYVAFGKVAACNYIFPFNAGPFPSLGTILWPGTGSNAAYCFDSIGASRVTDGLFYTITNAGLLQTVNAATDTNKTIAGSTPSTLTTLVNFTDQTITSPTGTYPNTCFNTSAAGGRWSSSGIPFNPVYINQPLLSDIDMVVGFIMGNVRNGCFNPTSGVIDYQFNTTYSCTGACGNSGSAPLCGAVTCGNNASLGSHKYIPTITPMNGNAGGFSYYATFTSAPYSCTTGSSGSGAPVWPQTIGSTVTDAGGCVWTAGLPQASYGTNGTGTGYISNQCSSQNYSTLAVGFHLVSGFGENAGDCDVYDTGNGHLYHNGTDQGVEQWYDPGGAGTPSTVTPLFTLHEGVNINPLYGNASPNGCVGTNSAGVITYNTAVCNTSYPDLLNANNAWTYATPQVYNQANVGHATYGWTKQFGTTTNPVNAISLISGSTTHTFINYFLPLQSSTISTSCPSSNYAFTNFCNGNYGQFHANFGPGEHQAKTYRPLPLSDVGPVFLGEYAPTSGFNGFDFPFVDPMVFEEVAYQTDGSYNYPIRLYQNNTSGGGDFASRYGTFAISQSGNYACSTSDGMNTFGGTASVNTYSGSGPNVPSGGNPADPTSGPDWQPSTVYAAGSVILPLLNNPPYTDSVNSCTFEAVSGGTSSPASAYSSVPVGAPNWQTAGSACSGTVTEPSGLVWTALQNSESRYDMVCMNLNYTYFGPAPPKSILINPLFIY